MLGAFHHRSATADGSAQEGSDPEANVNEIARDGRNILVCLILALLSFSCSLQRRASWPSSTVLGAMESSLSVRLAKRTVQPALYDVDRLFNRGLSFASDTFGSG